MKGQNFSYFYLFTFCYSLQLGASPYQASDSTAVPEPSREARMSWVATVWNLDWPSKPGLSATKQQAELVRLLDEAKENKINTLVFQVRSEGDAIYESSLEPSSYWLTGKSGAPIPKYKYTDHNGSQMLDPLAFAIKEAHRRGIELHAWVNPFRAQATDTHSFDSAHASKKNSDWTFPVGKQKWLNPGNKEAVQHVHEVVKDIGTRYDVDGIHIDDYFYPYPVKQKPSFSDEGTPGRPESEEEIIKWRQNNVNSFVKEHYGNVRGIKDSSIKVGISPFGIAANDKPKGVVSLINPAVDLAADSELWLKNGWLDYMSPQLYWITGGKQDFAKLNQFWQQQAENPTQRHVWPGIGTDRIGKENYSYEYTNGKPRPASEITSQITQIRDVAEKAGAAPGHSHWNWKAIDDDQGGIQSELKSIYRDYALSPPTPWLAPKNSKPPTKVENLSVEETKEGYRLKWQAPSDEKVKWFVIQVKDAKSNEWRTHEILPSDLFEYNLLGLENPQYISVRSVDNFGRLSPPYVMEHSPPKTQSENELEVKEETRLHQ